MAKIAENSGQYQYQTARRPAPSTDPSVVVLAERYRRLGQLRFVVIAANPFDVRAFPALFQTVPDAEVVDCLNGADLAVASCHALVPDVAVLSSSLPNNLSYAIGRELIVRADVASVAFFDDTFRILRAHRALSIGPNVRYFTRALDPYDLCRRLRTGAGNDDHSFVSNVRSLSKLDAHGLLTLTPKELEVLEWLAMGHSVRSIAEKLRLAESTVDNHKSNAMKKLKVHKSLDLVGIAVEAGIVSY